MILNILNWFEKQAFGVCSWIGDKLGIKTTTIRIYFIYLSFFTVGSPIIIYFILAFLLEHKHFLLFKKKKITVWDV